MLLDWQRCHWPCKHFIAIFKHNPQWGWEKLSPSYQNSPHFRIDDCLFHILVNDSRVHVPGNNTSPLPDDSPSTMADHLPSNNTSLPEDSPSHKVDLKEESNRSNDSSSDSVHLTSSQQSLKEAYRIANNCMEVMRQLQT